MSNISRLFLDMEKVKLMILNSGTFGLSFYLFLYLFDNPEISIRRVPPDYMEKVIPPVKFNSNNGYTS